MVSETRTPMPREDRGRLGARTRWGPPRILRLDQLDATTAEIIRAVLTARERAAKAGEPPDRAA